MTAAASVLARCLAASLAGALALAACGLPDSPYFGHVPPVREPGHLRYCGQGEPETLDPTMAGTTVAVLLVQQLFDGLLVYDLDGKPVPGLAERWEASSDLRTFTFHLRRGARWSNGRALDAYDLGYQVLRVLHPTTASANASNLPVLRGAAAFLERRLAVLRRDAGELRAGQAVEIVATSEPGANPNLRQVTRALPLRDLGAPPEAAYAAVPPGSTVELVGRSGSNVFPARGGERWAYVYWDGGGALAAERYGWVREDELGPQLAAAARFTVSRLRAREAPGPSAASAASLAEDDHAARPTVEVPAAALELSPEGLGVRVVDRFTLVLETNGPAPYFAHLAVNRALRPTPIEAVSRAPRTWATPGRIVTSGALHLQTWRPRDRVELLRSPTYWNPAEVRLDALTVYALDDAAAATNLYYAGRCDVVATNQIPGSYLPVLRGERRSDRRSDRRPYRDYLVAPFLSSYFVLLNVKQLPNVHLRRALGLAIDRSPIPAFTHGGEHPTAQIVPGAAVATLTAEERALCGVTAATDPRRVAMIMEPGARCYLPPPGLDYDVARAQEELALARRELGAAFPAELTYRYNEGSEVHRAIAELLQQQWRQAGISVELRAQEWGALVAATAQGDYQLARFGNAATFPDPATEYLELFACGSPWNRSGYCSPALEQRLAAIRAAADPVARDREMVAAEQQLVDEAVIIPLYVYTQRHLRKPYVRGLGQSLVDQPPHYRAWLDPAWRTRQGGAP